VFGGGESGRDYTYIDDIVEGTLAALDGAVRDFRVYNLGNSSPILLRELVSAIAGAVGRPVTVESQPFQAGDVPLTCANIERARQELGYAPKIPLAEGLRRFVEWFRSHPTLRG